MSAQSKSSIVRYILRGPLYLLILFLFYLLGKNAIALVEGFSLSLGLSETVVDIISTVLLVFFGYIGLLIILNYVRSSRDQ